MKEVNNHIIEILNSVPDPEIPVLSVIDLGMVTAIEEEANTVTVTITPTYSGCPAMDTIQRDIMNIFHENGYNITVKQSLDPAWTTDWISEEGKKKLATYGIAPPLDPVDDKKVLFGEKRMVPCPQCGSTNTVVLSKFGSTPCKSLFKCENCLEPFDYFKCH